MYVLIDRLISKKRNLRMSVKETLRLEGNRTHENQANLDLFSAELSLK